MSAYIKSIAAFLSLVFTNLFVNYAQSGQPIPNNLQEWIVAVLTTLAGTAAVYQLPNTPTVVVK